MVQSQETSRRTAAAAGRMESNSMSSSSWHVFRLGWASRKREHLREPTDAARDGRQARRDATRGTIRAVRRGRSRRLGGSRADSALAPRYPGILDGGSGRQKSVAASARQCFSCPALAADDSLDRGRGVLRSPIVTNARAGRAFVELVTIRRLSSAVRSPGADTGRRHSLERGEYRSVMRVALRESSALAGAPTATRSPGKGRAAGASKPAETLHVLCDFDRGAVGLEVQALVPQFHGLEGEPADLLAQPARFIVARDRAGIWIDRLDHSGRVTRAWGTRLAAATAVALAAPGAIWMPRSKRHGDDADHHDESATLHRGRARPCEFLGEDSRPNRKRRPLVAPARPVHRAPVRSAYGNREGAARRRACNSSRPRRAAPRHLLGAVKAATCPHQGPRYVAGAPPHGEAAGVPAHGPPRRSPNARRRKLRRSRAVFPSRACPMPENVERFVRYVLPSPAAGTGRPMSDPGDGRRRVLPSAPRWEATVRDRAAAVWPMTRVRPAWPSAPPASASELRRPACPRRLAQPSASRMHAIACSGTARCSGVTPTRATRRP